MSDPQPDDPYKEPDNSTVDDWHGQKVDRDAETAEKAGDEADEGGGPRASGSSAG